MSNSNGNDEWPRDLKTATRAEYVTMVKTMTKDQKPGGKKPCSMILGETLLFVVTVVWAVGLFI